MAKVKTLQENVLTYGEKKGAVLEVSDEVAKHLINTGVAEKVQTKKQDDKKKDNKKKESDK